MYRDDFRRTAQAAEQILRRKQNRYLDSLDAGSLTTAQAVEPQVHSWSRFCGWRLSAKGCPTSRAGRRAVASRRRPERQ